MKKYNLSAIMKRAWLLKSCFEGTFADFLRWAWREAKEGNLGPTEISTKKAVAHKTDKEIKGIAQWFLRKNFSQNEAYMISVADMKAYKETEKAYLIKAESDYGYLTFWAPKSVCHA